MTHKCEGFFQPKSRRDAPTPCTYNASYIAEDDDVATYYCGKHKTANAVPITGVKVRTSASKSASVGSNVCDDIYQAILGRIRVEDVPNAPHFVALTEMEQSQRDIVIRRATELAGVKNDVLLIARSIGDAMNQYATACKQKRLPIESDMLRLKAMGAEWPPVGGRQFCVEEGSIVFLPDVDIHLINCSTDYLREAAITFENFCEDEDTIYMGPKGATRSAIGGLIPEEDSEWYIPLPASCPLRSLHNKQMVIRILDDIAEGRQTKEKYLALRGKVLACVCLPYPCHCEVYVEVLRELLRAETRAMA